MTKRNQGSVLLTGATGELGSALFDSLVHEGFRCLKAGRAEERYFSLETTPEVDILENVDTVIHLAFDFACRTHEESRLINVEGSRRLLDLADDSAVKHVILVSSDSAQEGARSIYGAAKFETESIYRGSKKVSIIRVGLIGGHKPMGPFGRIVTLAKRLKVGIILLPDIPVFTFVSYEDLGRLMVKLVESEPCGGPYSASRDGVWIKLSSALRTQVPGKLFLLKLPGSLLYTLLRMKESLFGLKGLRSDSIKSMSSASTITRIPSIWKVLDTQVS